MWRGLSIRNLSFTGALFGSLGVAIVAIVVAGIVISPVGRTRAAAENRLGNPKGAVDRLDFFDTAGAWARGQVEHAVFVETPVPSVTLRDARDVFPRSGRWTSPEVTTAFAFTELLPSWNVSAPAETGLRLEVRVRRAGGGWSPWLYLGSWGRTIAGERTTSCRHGFVNIDYLKLHRPADAYQVRVHLDSFSLDPAASPTVRRVAVCYSGVVKDESRRREVTEPVVMDGEWGRDLGVPFFTQKDAPKPLSGEICSPTSVSMVLAHWGVKKPVVENAMAIYDGEYDLFGNWGRAVARAGDLGMDAWLTRFRNWEQVKAQIAAGQPVIASIRFERDEFPSAVLPKTNGHLIVIRGFTPAGDVIVNDPASRDRGDGAVYKADELARAWFDRGGVGYVIRPPHSGQRSGVALR